jgi:hypothetical protein
MAFDNLKTQRSTERNDQTKRGKMRVHRSKPFEPTTPAGIYYKLGVNTKGYSSLTMKVIITSNLSTLTGIPVKNIIYRKENTAVEQCTLETNRYSQEIENR